MPSVHSLGGAHRRIGMGDFLLPIGQEASNGERESSLTTSSSSLRFARNRRISVADGTWDEKVASSEE